MLVFLNVYNLHESNSSLHSMGLGFYHTGVEVNNYEYSFSEGGIHRDRPRRSEIGTFREQISMGEFGGNQMRVDDIVASLGGPGCRFAPGRYNLTGLNCNHFSDNFCLLLVGQHIPEWVNRMAGIGAGLVPPASSSGGKQPTNTDSGSSFAQLGKVAEPRDPNKKVVEPPPTPAAVGSNSSSSGGSWSIFDWFGGGTAKGDSSQSTSSTDSGLQHAHPPTQQAPAGATKPVPPGAKKELTEKQRALLDSMKKK